MRRISLELHVRQQPRRISPVLQVQLHPQEAEAVVRLHLHPVSPERVSDGIHGYKRGIQGNGRESESPYLSIDEMLMCDRPQSTSLSNVPSASGGGAPGASGQALADPSGGSGAAALPAAASRIDNSGSGKLTKTKPSEKEKSERESLGGELRF